jgi:hypothetical protein
MKQIITLLIMNFYILSRKNENTIKTERVVKEWIGNTIKFPDSNLVEIIKTKRRCEYFWSDTFDT